jgi:hypothetical protein
MAATIIAAGPASAKSPAPCVLLPDHASALRARPGNLIRENIAARRQKLSSLPSLAVVQRFTRAGLLVPVPLKTKAYVVARIRPELRVARPWTKRFIDQLSREFHASFKTRLKITSLTRTAVTQRALRRWNGNAAPSLGHVRSTHLTGAAVDISMRPLGAPHVRWLRVVLQRLAGRRLLSAIEEFAQPHFHVLVFRAYDRYPATRRAALFRPPCRDGRGASRAR